MKSPDKQRHVSFKMFSAFYELCLLFCLLQRVHLPYAHIGDNNIVPNHRDNDIFLNHRDDDIVPNHRDDDIILNHRDDGILLNHRDNDIVLNHRDNDILLNHRDDDILLNHRDDDIVLNHRGHVQLSNTLLKFIADLNSSFCFFVTFSTSKLISSLIFDKIF